MSIKNVEIFFLKIANLTKTEFFALEHLEFGQFCEGRRKVKQMKILGWES